MGHQWIPRATDSAALPQVVHTLTSHHFIPQANSQKWCSSAPTPDFTHKCGHQSEYLNRQCSWFHATVLMLLRQILHVPLPLKKKRKKKDCEDVSTRMKTHSKAPCAFVCRRTAACTGLKYVLCSKIEGVRKMNTSPKDNCAICNADVKFFLRLQI